MHSGNWCQINIEISSLYATVICLLFQLYCEHSQQYMYTIFMGVEGYFGSLLVCNKDLEYLHPWEKSIEHASY